MNPIRQHDAAPPDPTAVPSPAATRPSHPASATMDAIVQTRYGDPHDVLQLRTIERPTFGPDDVLVRVVAASVNTPDWATVVGVPMILRLASGLTGPTAQVRGTDVAGVVAGIGERVTGFTIGDEVFGSTSIGTPRREAGTFAELTVVPAAQLAHKPASVAFTDAAASVMSGLAALISIRDTGAVGPDTRVLVNGASGGVGTFAVQIAKARGAHVTGVASTANVELLRALGADAVIDYTVECFLDRSERYDVVLDNVMNHPPRRVAGVLSTSGVLIPNSIGSGSRLFGGLPRMARAMVVGLGSTEVRTTRLGDYQDNLAEIGELVASGAVHPVIDSVHPLHRSADAVARMLTHRARGNVVITVPGACP